MYAIDLFCGAGGFSEGLIQAGFHIVFSSDKSPYVQETYEARHEELGFKQGFNTCFKLADIKNLTGKEILEDINALEIFQEEPLSEIDAIFGGPPCQGFSLAGDRDKNDIRNVLFHEYVRVISEIKPKYVVMENVTGFMSMELNPNFKSLSGENYEGQIKVAEVLQSELKSIGYTVLPPKILNAAHFGVPQRRERAIFLAYRNDCKPVIYPNPTTSEPKQFVTIGDALIDKNSSYNKMLSVGRTPNILTNHGIKSSFNENNTENSSHTPEVVERFSLYKAGESNVQVKDRLRENGLDIIKYPYLESDVLFTLNKEDNLLLIKDFLQKYTSIECHTKLLNTLEKKVRKYYFMTDDLNKIIKQAEFKDVVSVPIFIELLTYFKSNGNTRYPLEMIRSIFKLEKDQFIPDFFLTALLTKKNNRMRLNPKDVAPTVLTLPDDFIHPTENRILTVREMATLQSFDHSFTFKGKRTTGGNRRKEEVPQYSQVGNAVPPLLAFNIALQIKYALGT